MFVEHYKNLSANEKNNYTPHELMIFGGTYPFSIG
jgi:hypothetical protein